MVQILTIEVLYLFENKQNKKTKGQLYEILRKCTGLPLKITSLTIRAV